jgi:DNA-binding beta-propeller fold protein YncE
MKSRIVSFLTFGLLLIFGCADDRPFLSGHIRRAFDGLITTCDPYNTNTRHTCVVYAPAFGHGLVVFDASAMEMVLGPNPFFPLLVPVSKGTKVLANVKDSDDTVPFFLALDPSEKTLFAVRRFAAKDGQSKSLATPVANKLKGKPHQMAAFKTDSHVVAILTYPEQGEVELLALNSDTGELDPNLAPKTLKVGTKPWAVEVDFASQQAVITDAKNSQLVVLSLNKIMDVIKGSAVASLTPVDIQMSSEKIFLSRRDLGLGEKLYALAINPTGTKVALADVAKGKVEATLDSTASITAAYFPGPNSDLCCKKNRHWFSYVTQGGQLSMVVIENENNKLKLKISETSALGSTENVGAANFSVVKMVGGAIIIDPKKELKGECNRKIFYIADFGADPFTGEEIEAQAFGCEKESGAFRMGESREGREHLTNKRKLEHGEP